MLASRKLKFVITLQTGKFGSSDNNVITLEGFRSTVDIDKAGGVQMSTLRARIYGMKQEDMNSATTLQWRPGALITNTVDVFANDNLIFSGNVINAWADYANAPDVFLQIQAQAVFKSQLQSTRPYSIKGGIDVALVMERIAKEMGLTFESNGVSVILSDVYLANTLTEQAKETARAANIDLYIDDKILAITNRFAPRKGVIPLISKDTGLVGYPTFDGVGVIFRTLYNPAIMFGGSVKIESDVKPASGEWVVSSIAHRLESERPGGAWFSTVRVNTNGLAITK